MHVDDKQLENLKTKKGLVALLQQTTLDAERAVKFVKYERRLEKLQVELIKLQNWVVANHQRVIIIFEGRDAAGKGGAIRRLTENLNPREHRVVALPKPNEVEAGQWYFQRYIHQLPRAGEIVFFDRSWYNRAVVEPVNGFCTDAQYKLFMNHVNEFERMIIESGTYLLKLYFSITREEQEKRFSEIKNNPLKKWKYSNVDKKALELWDKYTLYKEEMFKRTSTNLAPWKVFRTNRKTKSRIEVLEYILEKIPYHVKDAQVLQPEIIE